MNNRYKLTTLLIALMLLVGVNSSWAQETYTATFNLSGDGNNVSSFAYNGTTITGATMGNLLKVGITSGSSSGNYRGSNWPLGATDGSDVFSGSIDLGKYIGFTITPQTGYQVTVNSITFGVGRSATGPRQWQWRSNVNTFGSPLTNYTTLAANLTNNDGILTHPDVNSSWTGNVLTLGGASFSDLGSAVEFRLYGFNSEATGGTGGLQGNLTINITVSLADTDEPTLSATPTSLSNFDYIVGSGPSAAQSFNLTGVNIDDSGANVNAPTNFEVSTSEAGTYSSSIFLGSFDGSSTPVWVRLVAGLGGGDYSGNVSITSGDADPINVAVSGKVEAPNTATLPYTEDFSADLGDLYVFSASGATRQWTRNAGGYAVINGFNTGDIEDDWLIFPIIDFDSAENPVLTFDTYYNFGTDDEDNFLKLLYSTDYLGVGDPSGATWTEIEFTRPATSQVWTPSGNLNLSDIEGESVVLAFRYRYEPGSYREWRIDNIELSDVSDPELTASVESLSGFTYAEGSGPSSAQSFTVSGLLLDGTDITVTGSASFEVSLAESSGFGASVDIEYDGDELELTTVYVRLKAGLNEDSYEDETIVISGGGAESKNVTVSGEVIFAADFIETFANYVTTGSSYASGNFTGANDIVWEFVNARGDLALDGKAITLQNNNDAVLRATIPGGIKAMSFDYRQPFANNINMNVFVNGQLVKFVTTDGVNQNVNVSTGKFTVNAIGDVVIEFRRQTTTPVGNQATIDNIAIQLNEDVPNSTSLTGTAGYRLLASPVATTIQKLLIDNDIFTQCFTGAHYESGDACDGNGGANVFFLNNGTWTAATNATQTIGAGTGVLVYVYDSEPGEPASWPKALSVSGVAHTLPVSPTVNQSVDGFSLIGNPSTSTISFDEITRTNLYDVVYVWDPNFTEGEAGSSGEDPRGTGAGSWVAYNGIAGDLTDGLIAPFQSFLIATEDDGASLSITTDAVSGSTTLRGKEQEKFATRFLLRGEGMANAAWFTFSEHGELGTDRADAQKLMPYSSDYALLMSRNIDGALLDINNLPVLFEEIVLPVYVNTTVGGSYQLELSEANIPSDMTIHLVERSTGNRMQVEAGFSYTFSAEENRFAAKSDGNDNGFGLTSAGDPLFDLIFQRGESTSAEVGSDLPQQLSLDQNYPNPFNPSTQIRFALPGSQNVKLAVYDLLGREIAVLLNENMSAGSHTVSFDASALSSGVYVYRIESAGQVITRKMTLVK